MIDFFRRHWHYLGLGLLGFIVAFGLYALVGSTFQIGLNPFEFVIKIFAKLIYVGAAVMITHFVIKYFFTTIYCYCYTRAEQQKSKFMLHWDSHTGGEGEPLNPKIYVAVATHIGVFLGTCVLLALAF